MPIHTEEAATISGTHLCQFVSDTSSPCAEEVIQAMPISWKETAWFILSSDTGDGFLTHAAITVLTKIFILHNNFKIVAFETIGCTTTKYSIFIKVLISVSLLLFLVKLLSMPTAFYIIKVLTHISSTKKYLVLCIASRDGRSCA